MRKLIAFLFLLCSCEQKETTTFCGTAMTMEYKITVGKGLSKREVRDVEQIIVDTFDDVNAIYNSWNPESELSLLNRLPAQLIAPLSKELEQLLELTDEVVTLSNGRFDPTIAPLHELWKTHLEKGMIPPDDAIEMAASCCGWDALHFGKGFVFKEKACRLDLGGIAKGYSVDLLVERLNHYGSVFVEWGGEIRAKGLHPENRPWKIFISRLGSSDVDEALDVIPISDLAIATSGDYHQNWRIEETCYCHIIDPKTKMPLTAHRDSIASTSVCATSCAFADGLATAAMTFSSSEEAHLWFKEAQKDYPDIKLWTQTTSLKTSSH